MFLSLLILENITWVYKPDFGVQGFNVSSVGLSTTRALARGGVAEVLRCLPPEADFTKKKNNNNSICISLFKNR